MRRFGHWNWQYANDRARLLAYELTHPGWPWLTPGANQFLIDNVRPGTTVFEWGSGRSTIWLAARGAKIQSVEHDPTWYARVEERLRKHEDHGAQLIRVDGESPTEYVAPIAQYDNGSLDAVIVDGISEFRDQCAIAALPKIRPGGFILIDDAHRYFPAPTNAPNALPAGATPPTETWKQFIQQTTQWTHHRYTSGVTDTAIWVRPIADE